MHRGGKCSLEESSVVIATIGVAWPASNKLTISSGTAIDKTVANHSFAKCNIITTKISVRAMQF